MSRPPWHEKEGPIEVKQSTLDHFKSIPLAKSTLDDPDFRIYASSRKVTDKGKGHTLTGRTWNTETTIRELLSCARSSKSESPIETNIAYTPPRDLTRVIKSALSAARIILVNVGLQWIQECCRALRWQRSSALLSRQFGLSSTA